jgi:hypothetical protein
MPVPQRVNFLVGWAEEPALEKLINKGARCELVSELFISLLFLCTLYGLCG